MQVAPEAESQPLQPEKVEPVADVALKVTCVPLVKLALHMLPQLMAPSALLTRPEALPDLLTVRV